MTISAGIALDEAFAVYWQIARLPDDNPLSRGHTAPTYKAAAELVRSLIPVTYNFDPVITAATEDIWVEMVDRGEVLDMRDAQKLVDAAAVTDCDRCGHHLASYGHWTECVR